LDLPTVAVLFEKPLLLVLGNVHLVETTFDDAQSGALVAVSDESEGDERRVRFRRLFTRRIHPPIEKRCGRSAATTVMPTTLGASVSARNVSDPTAPGRASTSAASLNHVRISSGSVIVRHTTSTGASISMSRAIV
jgi:hypothetical protein